MSWATIRRAITHRFVAVPLALLLVVVAWNVYIAFNDNGIIEGEVRDRAGAPVAGATVTFFERNFIYYEEKQRAVTDAKGHYRFTDMKTHIGQLEARTDDGRKSERRQLRLWFRSQDTEVPPLVVETPRG
jgi:Carboxypeptidase regulatory-like domain